MVNGAFRLLVESSFDEGLGCHTSRTLHTQRSTLLTHKQASQSRATLSAVTAHESAPPSAVEKILADKSSVTNAKRGSAVAAAAAAAAAAVGSAGAGGSGPGKAGKGRAVTTAAARRRFVGLVVGSGDGARSHPYRRPAGK